MRTSTLPPSHERHRTSPPARHRRRPHRWRSLLVPIAILAVLHAGVGWYLSEQILPGLRVDPPAAIEHDTDVLASDGALVTLQRPDEADLVSDRDAVMGLRWDGGYGQAGPSIEHEGGREVRELTVLDGDPPPVGTRVVDVDSFAFPPDPARIGLDLETVTYPAPLGELEAWQLPGEGSTWIIAVHGGGADRHEFLRAVDATSSLAYPMLLVRYRNDPGMPATAGSLLLVGQEEWEDVAAAVEYALANGATDVVLHGASMGGALVLGYLVEGDASVVRGAILEAPNADIRDTIRLRAGEALPIGGPIGASLLAAGRAVVSLRTGLDFGAVDYVARADELSTPILLHHGVDDTKLPIATSEALAAARPDLVEFHPVPDAAHVRAWNEDPAAYEATLVAFLARIGRS
jgi:uncharacterized protein